MKKALTVVLCLALILPVVLCACSGGTKSKTKTTAPKQTVKETEATAKKAKALDTLTLDSTYLTLHREFKVGESAQVDEFGRLRQAAYKYRTVNVEYDPSGLISLLESEDGIYRQSFTIDGSYPVQGTNKSGNNIKEMTITKELDEKGRVAELTSDITVTDTDYSGHTVWGYEFFYNEKDQVSSMKYYTEGTLDHITYFTYDNDGYLTVFSSIDPEDNTEYIRMEMTYKEIDAENVPETDAFAYIYNWDNILSIIL